MLARKLTCLILLAIAALAIPAASQPLLTYDKPVLQADGTGPEPPPIPIPGLSVVAA